ncbi:heat shock transcription factor (nucleomorph) [Guillardia theta]|uniref:Heat shock transcription factor n=1 Tax=Guillardia theta TaxID=55529 RepID=Q98RQ0_GUITH|nr:heat shock transcription factor [Guillardia theta]AAK39896.1 heat shock transcription factor [Guillardia theta]
MSEKSNLAPFIKKLYQLVNDPMTNDYICWEKNETCFIVNKPTELSVYILPRYFKHNNFSSFVRQLNQYGFHKLEPNEWVFGHPYFKGGDKLKLSSIKRKKQWSSQKNVSVDFYNNEIFKKLIYELDTLKKYKQVLTKDILDVCRRQERFLIKQQSIETKIKKIEEELNNLKYLVFGYFGKILKSN